MAVLLDVAFTLCGGTGVWLRLVGAQGLPLLGQPVPVPEVILHVCQNHVSCGDVHVGLGRLLAPGRCAAVGTPVRTFLINNFVGGPSSL